MDIAKESYVWDGARPGPGPSVQASKKNENILAPTQNILVQTQVILVPNKFILNCRQVALAATNKSAQKKNKRCPKKHWFKTQVIQVVMICQWSSNY